VVKAWPTDTQQSRTRLISFLVFGQLVSGEVVDIGLMVLGVLFWIIIYIGAFSMSLDRSKIDKK
jgi:hypothetical protein